MTTNETTLDVSVPAEDAAPTAIPLALLRRWWAAEPGWTTPEAAADVRVGGAYRLSMQTMGSPSWLKP